MKYWVIFRKSDLKGIVMNMLKYNFRHVIVVSKSLGEQFWLIVDPKGNNIIPMIYPVTYALCDLYPDSLIVETEVKEQKQYNRFWHINCVEVAKKILGIKNWKIITPYQLYKHLLRGK